MQAMIEGVENSFEMEFGNSDFAQQRQLPAPFELAPENVPEGARALLEAAAEWETDAGSVNDEIGGRTGALTLAKDGGTADGGGPPRDNMEGLAILDDPVPDLAASAQGIHRTALFRIDGQAIPACEALVEVAPGMADGVTETDGLDVTAFPLGSHYPGRLLVVMDDQNAGSTTNFKRISLAEIGEEPRSPRDVKP